MGDYIVSTEQFSFADILYISPDRALIKDIIRRSQVDQIRHVYKNRRYIVFAAPGPELLDVLRGDLGFTPLLGVAGEYLHSIAPQGGSPVYRLIDMAGNGNVNA
jgi:hypothetical protein